MRIIGIDTSGLVASVAILQDHKIVAEYTLNNKKTHSATIMPMLAEIVKNSETNLAEVDAVAVSSGPGSFTGLRIGAATAKGLAYSLGKPVIAVSTTEALAYNLFGVCSLVVPIMDARRNQVYNGIYTFKDGEIVTIQEERALGIDELIRELNENYSEKEVIFLGDGVEVYKDCIQTSLKLKRCFAPAQHSKQRAGTVAVLGEMYYNKGRYESSFEHSPTYLRLSQAERERKEKENEGRN